MPHSTSKQAQTSPGNERGTALLAMTVHAVTVLQLLPLAQLAALVPAIVYYAELCLITPAGTRSKQPGKQGIAKWVAYSCTVEAAAAV